MNQDPRAMIRSISGKGPQHLHENAATKAMEAEKERSVFLQANPSIQPSAVIRAFQTLMPSAPILVRSLDFNRYQIIGSIEWKKKVLENGLLWIDTQPFDLSGAIADLDPRKPTIRRWVKIVGVPYGWRFLEGIKEIVYFGQVVNADPNTKFRRDHRWDRVEIEVGARKQIPESDWYVIKRDNGVSELVEIHFYVEEENIGSPEAERYKKLTPLPWGPEEEALARDILATGRAPPFESHFSQYCARILPQSSTVNVSQPITSYSNVSANSQASFSHIVSQPGSQVVRPLNSGLNQGMTIPSPYSNWNISAGDTSSFAGIMGGNSQPTIFPGPATGSNIGLAPQLNSQLQGQTANNQGNRSIFQQQKPAKKPMKKKTTSTIVGGVTENVGQTALGKVGKKKRKYPKKKKAKLGQVGEPQENKGSTVPISDDKGKGIMVDTSTSMVTTDPMLASTSGVIKPVVSVVSAPYKPTDSTGNTLPTPPKAAVPEISTVVSASFKPTDSNGITIPSSPIISSKDNPEAEIDRLKAENEVLRRMAAKRFGDEVSKAAGVPTPLKTFHRRAKMIASPVDLGISKSLMSILPFQGLSDSQICSFFEDCYISLGTNREDRNILINKLRNLDVESIIIILEDLIAKLKNARSSTKGHVLSYLRR